MKKHNIKIVEKGTIETNSSSSHSLTLGNDNFIKPGDKEWDVNIKDRILYIPTCENFGWECFKFNSLQRKLQYLSGMFFYEENITLSCQKEMKKLKSLLCKVFDIDDVVFEWVERYRTEEFKEDIKEEKFNPAYTSFCPVLVDHESRDLKYEIIESEETLKSFLFSRNSWVFGGNDGSDMPEGFYKEEKQNISNTTASIDFPGIGRIDFRIFYPGDISKYITKSLSFVGSFKDYGDDNLLKCLVYDIEKEIIYPMNSIEEDTVDKIDQSKYMEFKAIISYKGDYYCLFVQCCDDFKCITDSLSNNWGKAVQSLLATSERVIPITIKTKFKDISDRFIKVIDSGLVKENIDYKLFKIIIKSDEFDYIQ